MPLIPALRRQGQVNLFEFELNQPGLQTEFQDSQDYPEKACLKNKKQNKTKLYDSRTMLKNPVNMGIMSETVRTTHRT